MCLSKIRSGTTLASTQPVTVYRRAVAKFHDDGDASAATSPTWTGIRDMPERRYLGPLRKPIQVSSNKRV
jgi:hypothetical protein